MSPRADAGPRSGTEAARERSAAPAPAARAEPEEIELKLAVGRVDVVRTLLLRPPSSGIAGFRPAGPARSVVCVDRYIDTDPVDGRLRLAGLRARLREQDGAVVLAVKASITSDGAVSRRVEMEGPATAGLDPLAWPASDARDRVLAAIGGLGLVEIAALRQQRLQRDFGCAGTTVEISLDRMAAIRGRRVLDRRVEVEAELKAGDAALLQPLAAALAGLPGIGPAASSKLSFALGAREAAPASPAAAARAQGPGPSV